MAASWQSRFGKFSVAAEWAAELSGESQLILRGLETHNGISGPDHLNIAEHQSGTSPKQPFLWTGLVPITNFDCKLYPQIVDS